MGRFKILHKDGKARAGELITPHGIIETPNFIPVGTKAAVKALSPKDLEEIGIQVVLANTYHLMLRPGADLIQKMGGLHQFMSWDKPIMTDSGGFQVFSLGAALQQGGSKVLRRGKTQVSIPRPRLNSITEEGVVFRSHLDGSKYLLSPEKSMEIQYKLGADLAVTFDDHEAANYNRRQLEKSLELTEKWALRSIAAVDRITNDRTSKREQLLYGVVHGATNKDLRIKSAKFTEKHFDAIAIGGIYSDRKKLAQILNWVVPYLSEEKPRHLLGIGEVDNLLDGVERGMDLFDSIAPTRRARHGSLYVYPNRTVNIKQQKYSLDKRPIDSKCQCYTCQNFSRAYLRYLFSVDELLSYQLATYHNLFFVNNLMALIRKAIKNGQLKKLKASWKI